MAEPLAVPELIYGTAFKFDKTTRLVEQALKAGFRGIDTAGNKNAYSESLVGKGIAAAIASGDVSRDELYIQTKFTPFKEGRDVSIYPYDTTASIPEQIEQSVAASLRNLQTEYIDCLVLHSPYPNIEDTLTAWRAMETLVPSRVASLGLSNIGADSLRTVYESASIKPRLVQNRLTQDTIDKPTPNFPTNLPYPKVPFDRDVREYCHAQDILYMPWGLLWGNPSLLDNPDIFEKMGGQLEVSKQVACFACFLRLKRCKTRILCGTSKEERMPETLDGLKKINGFLSESEENKAIFQEWVDRVERILDQADE
ncbi:hypothetical protein PISL3812_08271 [Talaromyces islandicus]|uniref:NADP-dependent oxidoreductase domain-containing protein n=1 Tax=Talaromyces islandicus TaxID=28573 RepID=A0A0U1M6J7_TALIS|nr:hypothetical protein PISL3812_08271 [Talaromyces islandicus]